jgi:enamine deaminase RidA (YjgF/YER057c/UK114 family)
MREIKATRPSGLEHLGGYSDVLTVRGGARTIYVAGQTAWSVMHRGPDRPSLQAQTVECFDNVKRCLETAGASFDDVLKLTIFVVGLNRAGRDVIAEVRARYVNLAHPPASTMVGVERLVLEGQLIEVEAIAVVD